MNGDGGEREKEKGEKRKEGENENKMVDVKMSEQLDRHTGVKGFQIDSLVTPTRFYLPFELTK